MKLNQADLKNISEEVNSLNRREARMEDFKRYLMFHGKTKQIIRAAIAKEFSKPETVEELISRLVPLNLISKIITKLAGVYTEDPIRLADDGSTSDQELMEEYVEGFCLNQRMKEANRYFKLFKRSLAEVYVDEKGNPWFRNIPRHQYEVFSFSGITPNRPDVICKIVQDAQSPADQVLNFWSTESFWITDGSGNIDTAKMNQIGNPEGVNPYTTLPFVYINESSVSVDPIPDDDLMQMAITIPVILTDLLFAQKYQSWALIYAIGEVPEIPSNPNSVIHMNYGVDGQKPEVGTIKPDVDSDKVLSTVKTLIAMLLSTKNLSVGVVQANLDAGSAASGISKMLDSAESVEDKKDQQAYFEKAEQDLWMLLKDYMIPYWRANNRLADEYNKMFSESFEMSIYFKEPKVMITDKEQIEISKMRMDAGFSTLEMELSAIYPQMTRDQIAQLALDLEMKKSQSIMEEAEEADEEINGEVVNMAEQDGGYITPTGADVRKETLNGAQITAVVELVQFVAAGTMPRDAAKNVLMVGFNLDEVTAEQMLGTAGKGFKLIENNYKENNFKDK